MERDCLISKNQHREGTGSGISLGVSILLVAVLTGLLVFNGCLHAPGDMNPNFGKSFHAAFHRQVVNPEGPADPTPVDTQPGFLANEIYQKRYVKGMTEDIKEDKEDVSQELRDLQ